MTSERVWTSEIRGSAFVEPVKPDPSASPFWPKRRAAKRKPRLTDGIKHPVIIRKIGN
jgi:hypothetical protein